MQRQGMGHRLTVENKQNEIIIQISEEPNLKFCKN